MSKFISGGYSVGVPPLPIPNREVKPVRADGTASSGRVGRRHFSERFFKVLKNLFFVFCNQGMFTGCTGNRDFYLLSSGKYLSLYFREHELHE